MGKTIKQIIEYLESEIADHDDLIENMPYKEQDNYDSWRECCGAKRALESLLKWIKDNQS